jgi:hypothetical protein
MTELLPYLGIWFLAAIPVGLIVGQLLARAGSLESEPVMVVAAAGDDDDVLFIVK